MVGVVVVDDPSPFRRAVRAVLAAMPGFALLGEACSGEEAVVLAGSLEPDLVVMDIRMPGIGGVEATRRIAAARPGMLVMLVSGHRDQDLPADARRCGAAAYVHKEDFGRRVLEDVWNGRRVSGPARTGRGARP